MYVPQCSCNVRHGSISGPVLTPNIYMLPLGNIIRQHSINFHSYAVDTHIYIAMRPDDSGPIDVLLYCILHIKLQMGDNFLKLNQDKTEYSTFWSLHRKKNIAQLQSLHKPRVLTRTRRRAHITHILKDLHWPPVCFRTDFKTVVLVYKDGHGPTQLSGLCLAYEPSRTLRSSCADHSSLACALNF